MDGVTNDVLVPLVLTAMAIVLGTGFFGLLWLVVTGLVSMSQDVFLGLKWRAAERRRRQEAAGMAVTRARYAALPPLEPLSSERMWHQMQGTSRRSRRRR